MDWIELEQPLWLLLGLLVIPVVWLGRRSMSGLGRWRQWIAIALRALLVALLAFLLARPNWVREQDGLSVIAVVDRSESVPPELKQAALDYLAKAVDSKPPEDRIGLVTAGANPLIQGLPDRFTSVEEPKFVVDGSRTELGGAVTLATAVFPEDTARRLLLLSDGNENLGSLRAAAQMLAANGIPLDVLPLNYEHRREVMVDRLVAPSRAREGQTIPLRVTLRTKIPTTGRITLYDNDRPLDLSPGSPEVSLSVKLESSLHVESLAIPIQGAGVHRFRAVFTPDAEGDDAVSANNVGEAVTTVAGEGRILLADQQGEGVRQLEILEAARMNVDYLRATQVPDDLVELMAYDAIVLVNTPAGSFSLEQQDLLRSYVHDLAGGLVMVGGPDSFGAGGWIDSPTAEAMPVKMDPPEKKQMPKGALVLIMHSCEMPNGNYWGEQTALAAVNSLSSRDLVGVIDYNWEKGGAAWEYDLAPAGDKSAVRAAIRRMAVGDMPSFDPALVMAYNALAKCDASARHIIIISDGDPTPPSRQVIANMQAAKITCTGVGVFPHSPGMTQGLQMCVTGTEGRYYELTDPNKLPQIFIKEAQVVHRPLIVERDPFLPNVSAGLSPLIRGLGDMARLTGYILTAPRQGLVEMPLVSPDGDPILAHWQYGLGRSVAFTSTADGRWDSDWQAWPGFPKLWEQTMRWVLRSSQSANFQVTTRREGAEGIVEVEALDKDAGFLNFLNIQGTVVDPQRQAREIRLRQVGPGLYEGRFPATEQGSYIVNLIHSSSDDSVPGGMLLTALSNAYSPEYRAMESNLPLLDEVADMTGGRLLEGKPEDAALFDRAGLTFPTSKWDLTPPLTLLWLTLFLVDVAVRRVSIDWRAVATRVKSWMRRTEKTAAEATLSKLHERRKAVQKTLAPKTRYVAPREKTAPTGELSESLGAAERKAAAAMKAQRAKPPEPKKKEESKKVEPAVHTSSLFEAKRRAREEMEKRKKQ